MGKMEKQKLMLIVLSGMFARNVCAQNTFPANGNVGIGTTSPAATLDVNGETVLRSNLTVGNGSAGDIVSSRSDSAGPYVGSYNAVPLRLGTGYAERMRIDSSGNVGIGTTTTNDHKFTVRDIGTNGVLWSMAINNPANVQGSSAPGVGIKLSLSTEESGGTEGYKWDGLLAYTEPGAEFGNSMGLAIYTNQGAGIGQAPTEKMRITASGNVGIGTSSPGALLDVAGTMKLSGGGASIAFPDGTVQSTAWNGTLGGGDYAESVDITGDRKDYEPGDVLVVDPDHPGRFLKSAEPYSTFVSGVYSTKPGVVGRRHTTDIDSSATEVPMAMVGIVPTKVSAENGSIKVGDLLVTSSTLGCAMRGTNRGAMVGAIVGKSLGVLDSGTGTIEVLVTLQ